MNTQQDWRALALNAALRAAAYSDEDGGDALLLAVRRHRPALHTLKMNADRPQLMEFLERCGVRSLLPAGHAQKSDEQGWPYVGWYAVESEGVAVEVALPPGWVGGQALCLGADEAALRGFADRLNRYVIAPAGRCLRYDGGWENAPDIDAELDKVTWDDVVLRPDILDGVRRTVGDFFTQRDAFRALGFAWKRGLLLIGPPGTGKTMICKAAAASLPGLPFLYVRDLQGGRDVKVIFDRARQLAPCVLAFEDVDGLVNKANRSVFLNEMDGFQSNDGIFVIASSNHPGKIDEALLKRPSRFDRVFHVGLPGPDERREYCRRLLSRTALAAQVSASLDVEDLARQVAERTDGFTPAFLKEAFLSAALLRAQDGETRLDDLFAVVVLEQVDELRAHLKRMKDPDALGDLQSGGGAMSLRR